MMKRNRVGLSILLSCLIPVFCNAQQFEWKAPLAKVATSGFYRVALQPALTANLKSDLSDVRVVDINKKNVPYIIRRNNGGRASFVSFPILRNITDSTGTIIELDVSESAGTHQVDLVIANTAVERYTLLSGSNDRKQWYVIKENLVLTNSGEGRSDQFVQSLQYPFNRYPYLKLVIGNRKTDPVNILKAGIYLTRPGINEEEYVSNPVSSVTQNDSIGTTILQVSNNAFHFIDRIEFLVVGPKFYKRKAKLFVASKNNSKDLVAEFDIISNPPSAFLVPSLKVKEFRIEIENGDSPPLEFTGVITGQVQKNLFTYLEKEKEYHLLAGNGQAAAPRFDLEAFRDSIPAKIPELNYGPLVPNEKKYTSEAVSRKWVWPAILVMLGMLGLLTFRLLRDVKSSGR